jgi:hypothetical protein
MKEILFGEMVKRCEFIDVQLFVAHSFRHLTVPVQARAARGASPLEPVVRLAP